MKLRRVKFTRHVARMGKTEIHTNFKSKNVKGKVICDTYA